MFWYQKACLVNCRLILYYNIELFVVSAPLPGGKTANLLWVLKVSIKPVDFYFKESSSLIGDKNDFLSFSDIVTRRFRFFLIDRHTNDVALDGQQLAFSATFSRFYYFCYCFCLIVQLIWSCNYVNFAIVSFSIELNATES